MAASEKRSFRFNQSNREETAFLPNAFLSSLVTLILCLFIVTPDAAARQVLPKMFDDDPSVQEVSNALTATRRVEVKSAIAPPPKASVLNTLTSLFSNYTLVRNQVDLYCHLDKNIYIHNENIWFAAYVLNPDTAVKQHTLRALLVEESTKKIRASERYVIEGGRLAGGALFLPDSLPPGKYNFIAYTNTYLNLSNQVAFQQPIIIKGRSNSVERKPVATLVSAAQQKVTMKLFPEGGVPVSGRHGLLGIELKTDGRPFSTTGQLLEDGIPVSKFSTDQCGLGYTRWRPQMDKRYTIRLADSTVKVVGDFPLIEPEGYTLHVPEAVVEGDNLLTEIGGRSGDTCHLLIHNYRDIFFSGSLLLKNSRARMRLPVKDIPEGVATLTLFNAAGEPQVERAVYIKKGEPLQVSMKASPQYGTRNKVKLQIEVTDGKGRPVQAYFSLACVLASRLDTTDVPDMVRYYNLERFLPARAEGTPGNLIRGGANIERLLLTRFWTQYQWKKDVEKAGNEGHPQEERKCITGYVYYKGRPVAEPTELTVIGAGMYRVRTDSTGLFALPDQALLAQADQKPVVLPAADRGQARYYEVKWLDACSGMEDTLVQTRYQETAYPVAEGEEFEHGPFNQTLTAVTVSAKRKEDLISIDAKAPVFKSSTCNDWVCMYKFLNCKAHPVGTVPQSGEQYYFQNQWVTYRGCESDNDQGPAFLLQRVNGVYFSKQFYNTDYEKYKLGEEERMPTLYWSHNILTGRDGKVEVPFYTNDLTGKFNCILQGYSHSQGPISDKIAFRVVAGEQKPGYALLACD
jgi:hypothetical protein